MLETVSETGSTNADMAARLSAGEPVSDNCWLVADRQTAGRGRLGRNWSDGTGNFMGSTVVHFRAGDPHPGSLALVAGLAVWEAVSTHLPPPLGAMLKWPNDVLVGGAKLAGILLEKVGDAVVVGVGVNLAQAPQLPDRETIALARFGPAPDRDSFALDLARIFADEVKRWRQYGLAPVISRWLAAAHPVGTFLSVTDPSNGSLSGRFDGLDDSGALRLRLADGSTRVIHAGEVNLV